jgi:hypothetical protein
MCIDLPLNIKTTTSKCGFFVSIRNGISIYILYIFAFKFLKYSTRAAQQFPLGDKDFGCCSEVFALWKLKLL